MTGSPYFADQTSTRVQELLDSARTPVLLWPVGSTEPHGPHSPLSTDPIISIGICERVARRLADDPELAVLILPTLSYAVTRYSAGFAGRDPRQRGLAARDGRRRVQRRSPRRASRTSCWSTTTSSPSTCRRSTARSTSSRAEGIRAGYLDLTRRERAQQLTEEFKLGECHAGRYETSLVLAQAPELVDTDAMASLPYVGVSLPKVIAAGMKDFRDMGLAQAYCGAPAEATAEEGEATYDKLAELTIELIRALVSGTGGRDQSGLFGRV